MTYLITFSCYGNHLHGDETGSIDPGHHLYGARVLEPDRSRAQAERKLMDQPAYTLDPAHRGAVLAAIKDVCAYRRWNLLAAHVRTSHVHTVVEADTQPECIMNDFKSYSSRSLNQLGLDRPGRKRWSRHGSTRWLLKAPDVSAAVEYVLREQGEVMSVFEAE